MPLPPRQAQLFDVRRPPDKRPATEPPPPWRQYLRAWRRFGWVVVPLVALSVAAAVEVCALEQPAWEASAQIALQAPAPPVSFASAAPALPPPDPASELQTAAEELGSRGLTQRALAGMAQPPRLTRWRWPSRASAPVDPATDLLRQLQVTPITGTRLITLRFQAPGRAAAGAFLQGLIAAFERASADRQLAAEQAQVSFLTQQAGKAQASVQAAQFALDQFGAQHGVANASNQQTLVAHRQQQLDQALTQADIARLAQANATTTGLTLDPAAAPAAAAAAQFPPQDLVAQRANLSAEVARLASIYQAGAAPLVEAQEGLAAVNAAIAEWQQQRTQLARSLLASDTRQASDLRAALARSVHAARDLQPILGGFDLLERDLQARQAVYSSLLEQWQQAVASTGAVTTPVAIVDPVQAGPRPVRPARAQAVLSAVLLATLLGLALPPIFDLLWDGLSAEQAAELGTPLLALLPAVRGPVSAAIAPAAEWCAAALLAAQPGHGGIILCTSPRGGEGKTTLSAALAEQLARVSSGVLRLDANPVRPGVPAEPLAPGLSELLTGTASVTQTLRREIADSGAGASDGLWTIASGAPCASHALHLAAGSATDLLQAARARFAWIVVDGPALADSPDARLWAAVSDCTVVVAAERRTSRRQLRTALAELSAAAAGTVGVVVNRVRRQLPATAAAGAAKTARAAVEDLKLRQPA